MKGLKFSILVAAIVFGVGVIPAKADDTQKEIDTLKKRLTALEAKKKEDSKLRGSIFDLARFQIDGFVESRYTNIANSLGDKGFSEFQLTRVRPGFNYTLDKHFSARIQFDATTRSGAETNVSLRDAYLQYGNAGLTARAGQQKVPFGYEVYRESDTERPALERARVFGVLFPRERDNGVVASYKTKFGPTISAGILNGEGVNRSETNNNKSVAANVLIPTAKFGEFGASIYHGDTAGQDKDVMGVEHRFKTGRFSTRMEYVWGKARGTDLTGGYAQAGYDTGRYGNVFLRRELFSPDKKIVGVGGEFNRTSIGVFKDLNKNIRLTGEYGFVDTKNKASGNTFGIELQAKL